MDKNQPPSTPPAQAVPSRPKPPLSQANGPPPAAAPRLNAATLQQMTEMIQVVGELLAQPEVRSGIVAVSRKVGQALAPLAPAFKALGSMAILAGEAVSKLPAQFQQTVVGLANEGWFLDPELGWQDLVGSYQAIAGGDLPAAEALMIRHFDARLDGIEAKLSAALPLRASKFKAAFAAHRRGEYDLSILAFMAQADGACAELRGGHFFLRDRKTGKSLAGSAWGMDEGPPIARIARRALYDKLPISEQIWRHQQSGSKGLNRHAVMHGVSLDHDTKANSLRALSLLNYVVLGLDDGEESALAKAGKTALGSLVNMAGRYGDQVQPPGLP